MSDFIECDACREKPGHPPLCSSCYSNRKLIEEQKEQITYLKQQKHDSACSGCANKYGRCQYCGELLVERKAELFDSLAELGCFKGYCRYTWECEDCPGRNNKEPSLLEETEEKKGKTLYQVYKEEWEKEHENNQS